MDFNKNNTIIDISTLFSSPRSVLRVVGDISGHELPVSHGVLVLRVPHVGHAPHALRVAGRRQIGVHPGDTGINNIYIWKGPISDRISSVKV